MQYRLWGRRNLPVPNVVATVDSDAGSAISNQVETGAKRDLLLLSLDGVQGRNARHVNLPGNLPFVIRTLHPDPQTGSVPEELAKAHRNLRANGLSFS